MKVAIIAGCVVLSVQCAAPGAHANSGDSWPVLLPPLEYDHPYKGELIIIDNVKRETLQENCGPIYRNAPSTGFLPGCAHVYSNKCVVLIAEQRTITSLALIHPSWSYDHILRHEIGHCNGWPSNHAGFRSLFDDPYARKPENAPSP